MQVTLMIVVAIKNTNTTLKTKGGETSEHVQKVFACGPSQSK